MFAVREDVHHHVGKPYKAASVSVLDFPPPTVDATAHMSASSLLSIDQQRRQRRTARHVWSLLRSALRLAVPRSSRPLPKARPRHPDSLRGSSRTAGVPAWQRALRDSQLLVAEAVGVTNTYTTAYIPQSGEQVEYMPQGITVDSRTASARSTMRQNIKVSSGMLQGHMNRQY